MSSSETQHSWESLDFWSSSRLRFGFNPKPKAPRNHIVHPRNSPLSNVSTTTKFITMALIVVFFVTLLISLLSIAATQPIPDDTLLFSSPEVIPATSISPIPSPSISTQILLPSASIQPPSPSPPSTDSSAALSFRDVTSEIGITQPQTEQFGGATVADLNSDGHYDLILTYHNDKSMRIYFGTSSGNFVRSRFELVNDIHGVAVAPRTAISNEKVMVVSMGGGRGANLRIPAVYVFKQNGSYRDISRKFGLGKEATRGRVPVFINLSTRSRSLRKKNKGGPDLLLVNLLGMSPTLRQFAYENVKGRYVLQSVPGFANVNEERSIVTDMDNDGVMELVHFSVLAFFRVQFPFKLRDITAKAWPDMQRRDNLKRTISSVVELDYDNDGYMDLYLARTRPSIIGPRGPKNIPEYSDILLRNDRGRRYIDVSKQTRIPTDTDSMGVSAGDFNNDGFIDVIIATLEGPDILLVNQRGNFFDMVDPKTTKRSSTRGANVLAFDYDLDGRVDYITGQAFRKEFLGNFRMMKNMIGIGEDSHYLLVTVGNELSKSCTALNAVVTVFMKGNKKMVRRVGGSGAGAGGSSYLDTVHFGLGKETEVRSVQVQWSTRARETMKNVAADQKIKFGFFPRV